MYKAHWSTEAFVHICAEDYVKRHEDKTEIKVYSNQPEVVLYNNGELVEKQTGEKVFVFELELKGKHELVAKSGDLEHSIQIEKVIEPCMDYVLKESTVTNWFDKPEMTFKGFYSIKDTLGDIKKTQKGALLVETLMREAAKKRGDVAKNVKRSPEMEEMMNRINLEALFKQASGAITEDMMIQINKELSEIKK